MPTTTNGHTVDTGCVLDSHHGWHNHARMIAEAVSLGFELDDDAQALVDRYDAGETGRIVPRDELIRYHDHRGMFHQTCPHCDAIVILFDDDEHWCDKVYVNDHEIVNDIMDEAERWLNDNTAMTCLTCGLPMEWRDGLSALFTAPTVVPTARLSRACPSASPSTTCGTGTTETSSSHRSAAGTTTAPTTCVRAMSDALKPQSATADEMCACQS